MSVVDIDPRRDGVLPAQWIRDALDRGIITSESPIAPGQVQPNSLDLRLGRHGYRIRCSFLPGEEGVYKKLERYQWYPIELKEEGTVLEPNQACLFPLQEHLNLPADLYALSNPKSSIGRLDVFTRVATEHGSWFDSVPAAYDGPLFVEVVPRSFPIRVRPGDALTQIRFQIGDPYLDTAETTTLLDSDSVVLGPGLRALRSRQLPTATGVVLSINLPRRQDRTVGYRAIRNSEPIDLRATGKASVRRHWQRIYGDGGPIILEPDEFYIFASRELVRLPPHYCAEMIPFDATSGEVRTHYAGFFDSGFGYSPHCAPEQSAAAVVLEVRSRDVPFLLEDGQPLFRLNILRCTEDPDVLYGAGLGSHYQGQRLRLSKHFPTTEQDELAGVDTQEAFPFYP